MTIPPSIHTEFSDAIEFGKLDKVSTLVSQYPDIVNHPAWTPPPLHCAVLWNQVKIAETLLENGADMEMPDPDRDTTPLRYAIMYCKPEMVSFLLARGGNAGVVKQGGTTAMQLAREGANGTFEHYDDMPPRTHYAAVIQVLERNGVE